MLEGKKSLLLDYCVVLHLPAQAGVDAEPPGAWGGKSPVSSAHHWGGEAPPSASTAVLRESHGAGKYFTSIPSSGQPWGNISML